MAGPPGLRSGQCDEPGVGWREPARLEVERGQVVFEVNVQPLASSCTGVLHGGGDEPGAYPVVPVVRGDHGVEDECVDPAVPGDIDEPHQLIILAGAHPAEAVPVHLGVPVDVQVGMIEAFCVKSVDRRVRELASPLIRDRHATILKATAGPGKCISVAELPGG